MCWFHECHTRVDVGSIYGTIRTSPEFAGFLRPQIRIEVPYVRMGRHAGWVYEDGQETSGNWTPGSHPTGG